MDTTNSTNPAIVNGIFALGGAFIGYALSIVRDWINNRHKVNLEKVRIHEKDRTEAYKKLFFLARKITASCFPLAEHKYRKFTDIMDRYYRNKIELNYAYFESDIIKILDEFNERYICMTDPDIAPEMDEVEQNNWLERGLFHRARALEDLIKTAMRV